MTDKIKVRIGEKDVDFTASDFEAFKRYIESTGDTKLIGPYKDGKPPAITSRIPEAYSDEELRRMMDVYLPGEPTDAGTTKIVTRLLKTLKDWDAINETGVFTAKILHRGHAPLGGLAAGAVYCRRCDLWYETGREHIHIPKQCDHDWHSAIHSASGTSWDHNDRFEFCTKCRTAREKQ